MRVLLTGGSGQVGTELRQVAPPSWTVHAPDKAELDLASAESIANAIGRAPWDLIVNAGAYTAVDKAETDVDRAWHINSDGPAVLAQLAARAEIPIIHLSTDYVFDGTKQRPYVETDALNPLGVYGASKAAGELAVQSANGQHLILRTAWVVSTHGQNFVKTMLRLGTERGNLRVVNDQLGCPTAARDIAVVISDVASEFISRDDMNGIYHFVCAGEASWFDLAEHIFAVASEHGIRSPTIEPIATTEYPTPAKRPPNSRLATQKLHEVFDLEPRPWQDAVAEVVEELLSQKKAGPL
jgi:dTDP-4-dehydrorhamnose reductase